MSDTEITAMYVEPDYDWKKPSLAVVACEGNGFGCVLYTVGPHVFCLMEDVGRALGSIGLDDAPAGISVWEGKTESYKSYYGEQDVYLEGEYRDPTPEEWKAIQAGECPWNDAEWLKSAPTAE